MKIKVNITGMSCSHCTEAVKTAVEKLEGVKKAKVKLTDNSALIKGDDLNADSIKSSIEDLGYEVTSVEVL